MSSARTRGWLVNFNPRQLARTLAISGLLGLVVGLTAVAFTHLVRLSGRYLLEAITGIAVAASQQEMFGELLARPEGRAWFVLLVPALGGLIAGLLCARLAPEAMGAGTDRVIDAYHRREGVIRGRVPLVKMVASAVTIGSGGSAGMEGPVGQVGAGIGSRIADGLKMPPSERRVLVMAGFAAGIGAVFHAPMAAAIFAAEVLYRDLDIEHEVLVPAIIASTVAFAVFDGAGGLGTTFVLPEAGFNSGLELIPYTLLALVVSAGAVLFVRLYQQTVRRLGRAQSLPLWLRPAVGGLGLGVVALWFPQAVGPGYAVVQIAIDSRATVGVLALLALAKMVTTTLTAGSGGAGGLFAPSLVVGGALGGAVGLAADQLAPGLGVQPAAFVLVGMAAFFAAVSNAPLSTVIMVAEVVGNYDLIVPALWVCILAYIINRSYSIFEEQVSTRLDAPVHLSNMMGAVLHKVTVGEAMAPGRTVETVPPQMRLPELVNRFAESHQSVFPIVDRRRRLLGVVDGRLLRRTVGESGIDSLLIAADFRSPAVTVTPADSLYDAIGQMTASGFDELLVVDAEGRRRLEGLVSRRQIVTAYHRRMLERGLDEEGRAMDVAAQADEVSAPQEETRELQNQLWSAVKRGGVLSGIRAGIREKVLDELAAFAAMRAGGDAEQLSQRLRERELLGSTGIGDGLALPHPHSEGLEGFEEPHVVIGLLKRPVSWDAFDGQPVDTVCLLIAPSGAAHLALLSRLAKALADPTLRGLLRQKAPRKQILRRLKSVEEDSGGAAAS